MKKLIVVALVVLVLALWPMATSAYYFTTTIGFVGDSITAGSFRSSSPPAQMMMALGAGYSAVNQGAGGTRTSQWTGGSALLNSAITAFSGVSAVHIMLGTNDARPVYATTKADYKANIQSAITSLESNGFTTILLSAPPYILGDCCSGGWDVTTSNALLVQYMAALREIAAADPTHVFICDMAEYWKWQAHPELSLDNIHPNDAGDIVLGGLWANGYLSRKVGLGVFPMPGPMAR